MILLYILGSESEPISVSESMELNDSKKYSDKQQIDQMPEHSIMSQGIGVDAIDQKETEEIQSIGDDASSEPKSETEKKNE